MPRPARYSVDQLLDAAAKLLAGDGPGAVTMSAVARATGAPSGSLYHRFPTRAALCGELWARTEERFQDGFTAALTRSDDPHAQCVDAALFIVQWCRDHPDEAQVLLAGPDALDSARWPDPLVARHRQRGRRLRRLLAAVPADTDRVSAAVTDIPYAVVRRHLLARRSIPASADAIVTDCARALLRN
ncbi:TetR/AcrR family transcriptional regulator [Mycobacterium deserti]|uniref:TetR/AcrR family transcriptional regulator n=1 Tax=Mycobacterium deserti TaxID=2978347 RepID=A0ABT2MER1_9MYCO|nr:TetR/AcrR family transcriptional regulator [Mycobacterium deserti]MCT7660771.1 TetR/AcrR family transcriptional regulator [Mycobacterium deserti]